MLWPIDEADASQNPGKQQRINKQSNWVVGQVEDDTPASSKKKGVPKTRQPTKRGRYFLSVIVSKTTQRFCYFVQARERVGGAKVLDMVEGKSCVAPRGFQGQSVSNT